MYYYWSLTGSVPNAQLSWETDYKKGNAQERHYGGGEYTRSNDKSNQDRKKYDI